MESLFMNGRNINKEDLVRLLMIYYLSVEKIDINEC